MQTNRQTLRRERYVQIGIERQREKQNGKSFKSHKEEKDIEILGRQRQRQNGSKAVRQRERYGDKKAVYEPRRLKDR